jgi:predicted  nucleic acid-binding Zn-ribbon protein
MQLNNDEGNIGIITNARQIENLEEQTNILFKIGNKLEQRIATLEKVLQSHAKCIGEMRDNLEDMPDEVLVKTWEEK